MQQRQHAVEAVLHHQQIGLFGGDGRTQLTIQQSDRRGEEIFQRQRHLRIARRQRGALGEMRLQVAIVEVHLRVERHEARPSRFGAFAEQRAGHHPHLMPLGDQVASDG